MNSFILAMISIQLATLIVIVTLKLGDIITLLEAAQ